MKHTLRMAFLSLLLVLTLGVMPVFAESATDTDDGYESTRWGEASVSQYRTDIRDAAVFGYDLYYISGHYLMKVDACLSYASPVLDLNEIIQSETLRSIGYYDEVSVIVADYRLVLFSGNEGLLYFLKSDGVNGFQLDFVSKPLDYASAWGVKWKEFPIAPGLYDIDYEEAYYHDDFGLFIVACTDEGEHCVVHFDKETGKGGMVDVQTSEDADSYGYLWADGILDTSAVEGAAEKALYFYSGAKLFSVSLETMAYLPDSLDFTGESDLEAVKDYDIQRGAYVMHDAYRGYAVDAENQAIYFAHDNTAWKLGADDSAQLEVTAAAKLPFYAEEVRKGLLWDNCYLLVTDGGLYTIPLPGAYWLSLLEDAE